MFQFLLLPCLRSTKSSDVSTFLLGTTLLLSLLFLLFSHWFFLIANSTVEGFLFLHGSSSQLLATRNLALCSLARQWAGSSTSVLLFVLYLPSPAAACYSLALFLVFENSSSLSCLFSLSLQLPSPDDRCCFVAFRSQSRWLNRWENHHSWKGRSEEEGEDSQHLRRTREGWKE